MNVVYWPNIALGRREITAAIATLADIRLDVVDSAEQLARHLPQAEGLILANPSADEAAVIARVLREPNRLRWLHLVSAGQDGLAACALPAQVVVSHTPGATANAVGDHAMALLLASMRRLGPAWDQQRARVWDRAPLSPRAASIEGRTAVLLGNGAIGRYLQPVLRAFGADVRVVTRSADGATDGVFPLERLADALSGAGILICAIPLSERTRALVDEPALRRMRPASYLVNVARGPIVARDALVRCLVDGQLAGAALDVTDPEPLPPDDALWSAPNLIITPHYGGAGSLGAAGRMADAALAAIRRGLEHRDPGRSGGDAP